MADRETPSRRLRRLLRSILDSLETKSGANPDIVVRAVPLLFPISICTWRIRQRVTTPIGLVERHVLSALKSFGPSAPEGIDTLMGLGVTRIKQILEDMMLLGAPISVSNGIFSFCGQQGAPLDHFVTEVEHDADFILNGISGSLLSIHFLEQHRDTQVDFRPGAPIKNQDSDLLRLAPVLAHVSREFTPSIDFSESDRLRGFPDGFSGFVDDKPIRQNQVVIIAFSLLDDEGRWAVWSAGHPPCLLNLPGEDNVEYFKFLAGTSTPNSGQLLWKSEWNSPVLSATERANAFPEHPDVLAKADARGNFLVTLKAPVEILAWSVLDEAGKQHNKLSWKLMLGWYWVAHPPYSLTRIQPGDASTTSRLRLLRGSFDLMRHTNLLHDRVALVAWWDQWQKNTASLIDVPPQSVDELLTVARERADSEFREWLDDAFPNVAGPKLNLPIGGLLQAGRLIVGRRGQTPYGQTVLDLLQSARKSVDIITPVIADEKVLVALEEAIRRKVRVRLITSLRRRTNFLTAGFMEESDPADAVAILHRLAKTNVYVRCTRAHPHAKLLIVDDSTVLLSSANLNSNSLGWGAFPALEAGVVISDTDLAAASLTLFEALWTGSPFRYIYRADIGGKSTGTFDVHEEREEEIPLSVTRQDVHGASLFLFLPQEMRDMCQLLSNLVKEAQHSIVLAAMSLYDTQQVPVLHNALLAALARNISVIICVRPATEMNVRPDEWPDVSTQELLLHGMILLEIPNLHAKGILVDDNNCGIFSGNINPYSLSATCETCHIEVGLMGRTDHPWLSAFASFMRSLTRLHLGPTSDT